MESNSLTPGGVIDMSSMVMTEVHDDGFTFERVRKGSKFMKKHGWEMRSTPSHPAIAPSSPAVAAARKAKRKAQGKARMANRR